MADPIIIDGWVVAITGGRRFRDPEFVWNKLDEFVRDFGPMKAMVNGMAKSGVDRYAYRWAQARGIPVREFPADWETHEEDAGPRRNQQMIDENPDINFGIVFPGHSGTTDMARRLRKAEIERVFYDKNESLEDQLAGWG